MCVDIGVSRTCGWLVLCTTVPGMRLIRLTSTHCLSVAADACLNPGPPPHTHTLRFYNEAMKLGTTESLLSLAWSSAEGEQNSLGSLMGNVDEKVSQETVLPLCRSGLWTGTSRPVSLKHTHTATPSLLCALSAFTPPHSLMASASSMLPASS